MMVLTAVGCDSAHHHMLAMPLAAVLRHGHRASALLEAGNTRPSQKRENNQRAYTRYPQAMFPLSCHRIHLSKQSTRPRQSLRSFLFSSIETDDVSVRFLRRLQDSYVIRH
jgi:hypothetical protein